MNVVPLWARPAASWLFLRAVASSVSSLFCVCLILSIRLSCTMRTSPNAAALSAMAKTSVATIVSRTRTVCGHQARRTSSLLIGQQLVARAAHRLDRLDAERRVDLLAQVADIHLDDIGVAGEV